MKLAMRLPEKTASGAANDTDPRDDATTEIIDLASRSSYPAVANRKGRSDALGLMAGVGFVALLGAATLWGLNASRMEEPVTETAAAVPVQPAPAYVPSASPVEELPSANAGTPQPVGPAPVLSQPPAQNYVPAANPYASPTIVFDGGVAPAQAAAAAAAASASS